MSERSVHLEEGLRLFRRGEYFLAHETLEEEWIGLPDEERDFYQGLIHLAVGFLHMERGNATGAALQLRKAGSRLEGYPSPHRGVDVARLRAFLEEAPERARRGERLQPPELDASD